MVKISYKNKRNIGSEELPGTEPYKIEIDIEELKNNKVPGSHGILRERTKIDYPDTDNQIV